MDIIINNDFGEIYKFKVNKNDRIFDIKVQIQSWSTIPTDRQHLFYHDQELKDDKTVNDYKIKEEETIFNKISSISKDDNQNSQQPEPEQTLLLPKSEQNRHQSESPNEDEKEDTSKIKITIQNYDENFSTYMVSKTDTFSSLKNQIQPYQIDVFYENTPLNPTDSLFDYSIHDGSIIKFKMYDGSSGSYPIKIKKTYSGESYTVDVLSSYTIDDLVSKIHEQIDLPNSITHLVMEGRVLYPSYNNLKLRELGIKEGSILHIMFRYY